MKHFAAALAVAGAVTALATSAAPAVASSHHTDPLTSSRRASGPYYIWAAGGSGCSGTSCAVGADSTAAGNPVVSKTHPGREMYFISKGQDVNGYTYGLWQFKSSGNYMAVTTSSGTCGNVTIKSDSTANGTIWILYTGAGHFKFMPRFCSTSGDYGGPFMYTDNRNGDQWRSTGFDLTGQYEKVDLAIP